MVHALGVLAYVVCVGGFGEFLIICFVNIQLKLLET